jgi:tRNA threonylcarbamoyladenosine biosynthesis protein TsaE
VISHSIGDTHKHAAKILKEFKKRPLLILLTGDLGAGKTEWARGFIQSQTSKKTVVTSPSYSLLQAYGSDQAPIYHADFYRLKSVDDLESTGFWDLLTQKSIVIAEWGMLFDLEWPANLQVVKVNLSLNEDESREISVEKLAGFAD